MFVRSEISRLYGFESVPNAWSLDRDITIQQHAARIKRITGSKRPVVNGGMLPSQSVREFLQRKTMIMNYRMVSQSAVALALFVVSASAFAADSPHAAMMLKCAGVCADCQVTCDSCFHHCASLVGDGKKEHAKCMHLCVDCAECCKMCATLCARQSDLSATAAECCAKCCDDCAAACEKFADDKQMTACGKSCRDCAKSCRDMAKMMK